MVPASAQNSSPTSAAKPQTSYPRKEKYSQALAAIESAGKLDPDRTDVHYLRGQILLHLGRKAEGQKELEAAVRIDNDRRTEHQKQIETGAVPSPELMLQDLQ
jgi:tetratricopeptide (TPR) repeat protein